MDKERSITSFIDNEHRQFSRYVCYHRAIPGFIDGLKPSQRKGVFTLLNKKEFIKVQSVSGRMISETNYNHGDASASEAISKMAQDFTGANNIPPFLGKGAFGSKFIKDSSAPRYIYVKPNPKYYSLYNDFELCDPDDDIENPEPKFFLPIVPTILLNGIEGIAVGFACKIQPYNIKDIIGNIKDILDGNDQSYDMVPFFSGYTGEVNLVEDKWVMSGRYELINTTTIHISEVPINYDREKYHAFLGKLISKNLIKSFNDNSKNNWDITIKLTRNSKLFDDPIKYLGLSYTLNENITTIDENGKLKIFNDVYELINRFVHYRLSIYNKRIKFMLNKIKEEILLNRSKMIFITEISNFDFKKETKKRLTKHFKKLKFRDDHLEKCFGMQVTNLNREYMLKLKERLDSLKKEWEYYKKVTTKELYLIDLGDIKT